MAKTYSVTGFRRLGNTITLAMARHGRGPAWELTVRGRRSGTPRTIPVTPIEVGGLRYLVAPYGEVGWVHNIRAAGSGALSRGGVTQRITVIEVDGDEAGKVLMAYHGELERIVGKYFELPEHADLGDFTAIVPDHPVFRIV